MHTKNRALENSIWFFDYDGTLCPHREAWEFDAYDPVRLCKIFDTLSTHGARVYWSTGRSFESLMGIEPSFAKYPGFFEHASVYWNGKEKVQINRKEINVGLAEHVKKWVEPRSHWLRHEVKSYSIRLIPLEERFMSRLRSEFHEKFPEYTDENYKLMYGWRALELMSPECDKAKALLHLRESGELTKSTFLCGAGDDLSDQSMAEQILLSGGTFCAVGEHCGWMSSVSHTKSQLHYFDDPRAFLEALEEVGESRSLELFKPKLKTLNQQIVLSKDQI